MTGGDFEATNPVIPVGFKTSDEGASWEDANNDGIVDGWNDGLVIQDGSGNQFVWVPVDGTNVTYDYHYSVGFSGSRDCEESLPTGIENEDTQIAKYGGFYIARYEAGIPESMTDAISTENHTKRNVSGIPVSKKNQEPWNWISWGTARDNAACMYKLANTNNHVQSVLITDRMWDTTMQWLEKSGIDVKKDSSDWGNYSNGKHCISHGGYVSIEDTGCSEYWKAKNIYDLAGNLFEFTNSHYYYNSTLYYIRGGAIGYDGEFPAAYRKAGLMNSSFSFRVGLFVQ